ncbi:hypothetical protein H072_7044 [Dactylellina haptotyla CBS 200.50]|uniref:Uncharacterized protein n=1 Tax=Dactylellina haptotyla (strain CBS 200.50) TaxID=1284197 RepID=S8A804_DACHA|nr:hypothetical protein H072_7044 [Dactylellina haptotyla CBS 200.50]
MQIYVEIQADDCTRAIKFYTTIFPSWSFTPAEGLPIEYHRGTFSDSAFEAAINILKRPAPTPAQGHGTNAFVCSFPVEDEKALDELEKKVLELGGQVAMAKFPIPERGWHGYFLDTEGNTFGVFTTSYRE